MDFEEYKKEVNKNISALFDKANSDERKLLNNMVKTINDICEKEQKLLWNYIKQLKGKLESSEKARKEAIETIKKHLEAKTYGNHKYELFGREYLEEILKILDIDKGE